MKGVAPALLGVFVSGAALVGLVAWGRARENERRKQMAQDDPMVTPIAFFPGLKVGDLVLVDSELARLPMPFAEASRVPCEVDIVLQDPLVVSVKCPPGAVRIPGVPFFSGTIPRSSILSVIPPVSFEV